jgi:hypothetical protein
MQLLGRGVHFNSTHLSHKVPNMVLTECEKRQLASGINERVNESHVLFAITELIGPCVRWPNWVVKMFWGAKLNNVNAMRLTTFLTCNGLPSHLMHQWLHVRGVEHDTKRLKATEKGVLEAMALSDHETSACAIPSLGTQFFYFDLIRGEYCFANGSPRNQDGGLNSVGTSFTKPFRTNKSIERQMINATSLPCTVCGKKVMQRWRHGHHKLAHVRCTMGKQTTRGEHGSGAATLA